MKTENSNKRRRPLARLALAATLAMTTALAGCGSDDNSTNTSSSDISCATGSISGAGSTFVQTINQQWIKDYSAACTNATINYQGVGSGAGIQQLIAGTVDFAASDVPLTTQEATAAAAKWSKISHVPWSAGGIAIEYNLPGVEELRLSPATLASIFMGKVKTWDSPALAADNPNAKLPSLPIQAVHRSDGSGTTAAFTEYLNTTAPEVWTLGFGKDVKWPTGQGAKGSDGVTATVKSTQGAIGYAELSYPKANNLGIAKIKNTAGNFTSPEGDGVTEALEDATVADDGKVVMQYKPAKPAAYGISTVTYLIVPHGLDAGKSTLLDSYGTYALGDGQSSATSLYYAPLPDSIVNAAVTQLAAATATP